MADNEHTGAGSTDGPATDLHTVWQAERPGGIPGPVSPVVADGTLYLAYSPDPRADGRRSAWVEAFDAATGESRWTTELFRTSEDHRFLHSDSLVLDDDRLFVQTKPGLTKLTTDGAVEWRFDNLDAGQQAPDVVPPVVTDDVVVTGSFDTQTTDSQVERLFGLDPATGEQQWRVEFPERVNMWQLSGTDDTVFVPFLGWGLLAVDAATGEERWRWRGPVDGAVTVTDDHLLVPVDPDDADEGLLALDRSTRSVAWRRSLDPRWTESCVSVADGRAYCSAIGRVEALDVATGERLWQFGGGFDPDGSPTGVPLFLEETPVVSGSTVYAPGYVQRDTVHGYLFTLDAASGSELGRVEFGRNETAMTSTPAVTSDLVFVNSNRGVLRALGECSVGAAGRCLVD
jgi:outer membrane protein assembly factor BamB